MTITNIPGGLPPSPPQSSEEFNSDHPMEVRSSYQHPYGLVESGLEQFPMANEYHSATPPHQMVYGSMSQYYPVPTSHPIPIIPGHHVTTPSMMPADLPIRVQYSSPSSSPSPSRKFGSKGKAKASRSPRERRGRKHRNSVSGAKTKTSISGPLSEITAEFTNVPVRDMEAYVNRPTSVRIEQSKERLKKEKKAIARPMNAFMLYRSAYTGRCKAYLGMENHQELSKAIGASWKMESASFKDHFSHLARIERSNHAIAFPEYKFQPKKDSVVARRSVELTPPRSVSRSLSGLDEEWEDLGDPGFSMVPPPMHRRTQSYEFSSRASTPFDGYGPTMASSFDQTWESIPSHGPPSSAPTIQPGMLQSTGFEGAPYGIPTEDMPSGINGIPGGSHEDLCQSSQPFPPHVESGHMDPALLHYSQDSQTSHVYSMGFEDDKYIQAAMSGHSSPAPAYPGMEMEAVAWEYGSPVPSLLKYE